MEAIRIGVPPRWHASPFNSPKLFCGKTVSKEFSIPFVVDRRGFLKTSLAALSTPLFARAYSLAKAPVTALEEEEEHWALLSDTHISLNPADSFRGFKPHHNLATVCTQLMHAKFDAILFNGDLARMEGRKGDYEQFTSFIDPLADHASLVMTLGNHDDRTNARSALTKISGHRQDVERKLVTTFESRQSRFVLLDSLFITNVIAGRLGKSQREWLDPWLGENSQKATIVMVHHNPVGERVGELLDAEKLLSILDRQRHVKALIYGHTHTYRFDERNGLHLINLPAVAYNFADGEAVGWVEASFTRTGADVRLHAIAGETKDDGKTTSVSWRSS